MMDNSQHRPLLVVLAGPTAVGKTDLSVKLAQHYNSVIVSCDARQFYQEISIGTAKPSAEEQDGVVHYFISSHSIQTLYGAGDYERDALALLEELFTRHEIVFLVGGSGLFIKALLEGFDAMPSVDPSFRNYWMERLEKEGVAILAGILSEVDPLYAQQVDLANPQRVVRALEVFSATGKPLSSFYGHKKAERPFRAVKIALDRPRPELYERINSRVVQMLEQGWIEEAKRVAEYSHVNALQTVGYKEIFAFLRNEIEAKDLPEKIAQNTRRFAKRQLTWFRHQDVFQWFHPDQKEEIITLIDRHRVSSVDN